MIFDRLWHKTLRRPYRLHATSHGNESAPVIVLLHGIAASGEDWGKLIPQLTQQYRCVTIDLLGFGRSPKPQWNAYTMEDHLTSLHHTLQRLRLPMPFILTGHSLGGLLASAYAHRYPAAVSRLLLLNPPVYPPLDAISERLALKRTDLLLRLYKTVRTHPRATPANLQRLNKLIRLPVSITANPATWLPFMRTLERCIEQQTVIDDVTQLSIPIDVFYGTLDSLVVGANLKLMTVSPHVRLHAFVGNHSLGRAAARAVGQALGVTAPPSRATRRQPTLRKAAAKLKHHPGHRR